MTTPETNRAEAIAWLVGRLRFEQLLTDLQAKASTNGAPTRLEAVAEAPAARAA